MTIPAMFSPSIVYDHSAPVFSNSANFRKRIISLDVTEWEKMGQCESGGVLRHYEAERDGKAKEREGERERGRDGKREHFET